MILHRTRPLQAQERREFVTLTDLWTRSAPAGAPPDLHAFDVSSDPRLLSNLALIELERGNANKWMTTYRYVGVGLRQLLGRDVTGQTIGDAYPADIADEIMAAIHDCLDTGMPFATRREFRILGVVLGYDRLLLPFGRRGGATLVAAALYPVQAWLRHAGQWQVLVKGYRSDAASSQEQARLMWSSAVEAHCDPAEPWYV